MCVSVYDWAAIKHTTMCQMMHHFTHRIRARIVYIHGITTQLLCLPDEFACILPVRHNLPTVLHITELSIIQFVFYSLFMHQLAM